MIKKLVFILIFIIIVFASLILLYNTWKNRSDKHIGLTIVMVLVSLLLIALAFISMMVSMSIIYPS